MKKKPFCAGCDKKKSCKGYCEELKCHLNEQEAAFLARYAPLSTDYMDKVFSGHQKADMELFDENGRKQKETRGKAIKRLISVFSGLKGEEGKSLKFFLIWKMYVDEGLKQQEIADIIGVSRQRISQILIEIRSDINKPD